MPTFVSRKVSVRLNPSKIYLCIVLFLVGCHTSEISVPCQNRTYRSFDSPVEQYKTISNSSSEFDELYIQWEVAHNCLMDCMEQGKLARLDNHRKSVRCLMNLATKCSLEKADALKECIPIYESLLVSLDAGSSPRTILPKYKELRGKIQKIVYDTL